MSDRQTINVRLDPEVRERLTAAAKERIVSVNLLVAHFIADGLDRLIPIDELQLTRPREVETDGR